MLNYRSTTIITLLFSVIAGFGFYNHEMWRDEFEIFMELRDTPDFLALFPNIQPLPNLYLTLLYPVIKLWPYPAAFQVFHLLVIVAAVFIFNKYSPFSYVQKIFFTFSYFVLFEYGIISRDYSMLLLLTFFSVYLITREKQHFIFIAVSLLLLANHHLYGVFISIGLFIYEAFHVARRKRGVAPGEKKRLLMSGVLLAAGALYIFLEYFLLAKFNRFSGLGQPPYFMTLRSIWNAFFPIPGTAGMNFWNTNIFPFPYAFARNAMASEFITSGNIAAVALSILILSACIVIFSRKLPVLIVFLVSTSLQLILLQYLSVFYVRYQGPLLIIFICCYWLLSHSDENLPSGGLSRIAGVFRRRFFVSLRKWASPFVTLVLFVQFCAGIFCYIQDARYPFTASYEAAKYIKAEKLDDNVMAGYIDYLAQAISGHLGQRIYYPQSRTFGTHMRWLDTSRRYNISVDEVVDSAIRLHYENKKSVLLILSAPLLDRQNQHVRYMPIYGSIKLKYLNEFTETIVPDEQYFLYLIYSET